MCLSLASPVRGTVVLTFYAAFVLLSTADILPADVAALLSGVSSQAVVTETATLVLSIGVFLAVLARLDAVLFQYIGCAGRARLEAVGAAND